MFRKMRRSAQQIPDEEAIDILKTHETGILAVSGDDDYPYSVPVNYLYKDGKIYFHGARTGHKYESLVAHNKVSMCVISEDKVVGRELTTAFRSVIIFGKVRFLEGEELADALWDVGRHYCDDDKIIQAEINAVSKVTSCAEITIEHMTGKEGKLLMMERKKG